jgi:hypothetical protein
MRERDHRRTALDVITPRQRCGDAARRQFHSRRLCALTRCPARAGVPRHLSAHRAIYAKHPADRPLVRAGRTSMLQYFGGNATAGQIDQR